MNKDFNAFIDKFTLRLKELFHIESNINHLSLTRGLPDQVWSDIMDLKPLSVAIPKEFGGRGAYVKECLGVLSAASYESLSLSLTMGINIALFLEPLAKYGNKEVQDRVFDQFINHKAMGGLMITEPDFGSDALNMVTAFKELENSYHIKGQKHWQGLTGMADYWLVVAREQTQAENLSRDVGFFLTENAKAEQKIEVEQYFNNPGLYMIPYGLNNIDIQVPKENKLQPVSTGIKMMLDVLHRSRMQFPGMGMGFIKRMLNEALTHCTNRKVGGKMLFELDSVQYQLSRIQSSYTICSGMCAHSAETSGIDQDLSGQGLEANSIKALVTDLMNEAANICVQLFGSKAYKTDHIAGRGIMDSRPFQIFEGANEMLYSQISEMLAKQMKRKKLKNFYDFVKDSDQCNRIADRFKNMLQFELPSSMVQRQSVTLGKIMARLVSLQYVFKMVEKGFREDLYENCVKHMEMDVKKLLSNLISFNDAAPILDYSEQSDWQDFI